MSLRIGIDPGVHTGVCVYDRASKRIVKLVTTGFWGAIDIIAEYRRIDPSLVVCFEDPNGNKPVFLKGFKGSQDAQNRMYQKVGQNVGSNKREASLVSEYCQRNNIQAIGTRPTARSLTKLKADAFARITGWTERSSEHARDAAMLVWGM